jgi:ANTAR domain
VSTTELSEGSKRIAAGLVTALTAESVLRACPAEPVLPTPTAHTVPTAPSSGPTAPALMYVYRVEAGAAFDVLKWRSQETHVKLRALAAQLLADIRLLSHDDSASYRAGFDRVLLTAHQRV